MRDALFFAGFLGFVSGILCRSFLFFSWPVLVFLFVLCGVFIATWFFWRRAAYLVCGMALLGCLLGASRVMLMSPALPSVFFPLVGTEVVLEGRIVAEPDIRENTQRVTVEVSQDGVRTKVLAVTPLYPEVKYGDHVLVEGSLKHPEPFATDTGRTFRYDRFLAKNGIFALVEQASVKMVSPGEGIGTRVMGALLATKRAFQNGIASALPEPGASLASGLITGGKQGLGANLLDAFILTGLIHIVVLSGYNVMIVAEGVLRAFGFLPKRLGALVAMLTIGLFVLAAGAGAASVRAGLMAALALVARATGRTYAVVRALLVVAFIMLLLNPLLLAFDPGFQLSFVATLGLILFAPVIEARLTFVSSAFWRDIIAATLAAQLFVLPLLLYQTGLFSLVSLPANLLVLPLVPLAMALSAVAGLVGMVLPSVAPLFGLPAHLVLSYILEVARFMGTLPAASVQVPQFPFLLVLLAYLGLAYVIAKAPAKASVPRALLS